ncbi:MAG: sugar transferase, partial [Sedimenticola sp.]|nr:sugar transferase [Sedimenticola sp.]
MKPPLLYLCHRIPYPPNKGDKIRSFHLLKDLNEHYEVYLGAFIDDPKDWEYVPKVNDLCRASCFLPLDASRAKLKSLIALPMGDPLTLPYYYNRKMMQWVDQVVTQHKIERAIVYSSAMAQYITDKHPALNRKVIDFVDIDSDKWRQYSQKKSWPLSWVYQREADKLFAYEKKVVSEFDA